MDEAIEADRVIVIDDGNVLLDGTPKEVFSKTAVLKGAGLDTPQVTELVQLIADEGIDLPRDILFADEGAEEISKLIKREK